MLCTCSYLLARNLGLPDGLVGVGKEHTIYLNYKIYIFVKFRIEDSLYPPCENNGFSLW